MEAGTAKLSLWAWQSREPFFEPWKIFLFSGNKTPYASPHYIEGGSHFVAFRAVTDAALNFSHDGRFLPEFSSWVEPMKTIRVSYPSSWNPFSARAVILPNAYANVIFLFDEQDDVHVTQQLHLRSALEEVYEKID
jgi:hypothetical protein